MVSNGQNKYKDSLLSICTSNICPMESDCDDLVSQSSYQSRRKRDPYTCPRCDYTTPRKPAMRYHLYHLKKPCPKSKVDIELTDEIREYILQNRVYHVPKEVQETPPVQTIINKTINQYNTMNNFISNMDVMDKLSKYLAYKQMEITPFERSIENRYQKMRERLEKGIGHHSITQDDIYEIIDEISQVSDNIEDFNIMYDSKVNKLLLYDSGDWKEMFLTSGLKTIIRTIQDYFWHSYECYLIRKIRNMSLGFSQRAELRQLLFEYYAFLASLDIDPYVQDKSNNKVLYSSDDDRYWQDTAFHDIESHTIEDEYMKEYRRIKDNLTRKEIDRLKKDLLDLIRRNSKKNISELNKNVMSLINVDEEFKKTMVCHML
jgi:hypothetical protein